MKKDKVSLISTVLNEEKTIKKFLDSIFIQTKLPDEIIIVDGGSKDATKKLIASYKEKFGRRKINFKLISKKVNRSIGRNIAIENAKNEIIVCSDAGCILDKEWIENIVKPFKNRNIDVVSGYYKGISGNNFEKSLIPYVLIMDDKINKNNFLPSSRSIAFKKNIWKKVGGFPQKYNESEDYIFAKKLKRVNAKIVFEKNAVVNWIPRKNFYEAFIMFYKFAKSDATSLNIRWKVIFIFVRYFFIFYLLYLYLIQQSLSILFSIFILLFLYIIWSILKNYKYVKNKMAFIFLPILQILSDLAVILGTILGITKRLSSQGNP